MELAVYCNLIWFLDCQRESDYLLQFIKFLHIP